MQVYFFLFAVVIPMMRGKGEPAPQEALGRRRRPGMGSAFARRLGTPSRTPPKLDATATRVIG